MAELAKLQVILEAESSKLRSELEKTNNRLDRFGKKTQGVADRVSGMFKGFIVAGAAAAGIRNIVNAGDELAKTATRLGAPVEELSRLQHAAELSDVSFEKLSVSLAKMARNASEAAGGSGEAITAFQDLGLAADKLVTLSPDKQLAVIADALQDVDNQSKKIEIVQKIFGRGGNELITLLDQGSAGLRAMGAESDALGATISTKTARASEEFNDSVTRLQAAMFGFAREIFSNAVPQLIDLTEFLGKKLPVATRIAATSIDLLKIGFKTVEVAGKSFVGSLQEDIGKKLKVLGFDELGQSFENVSKASKQAANEGFQDLEKRIEAFRADLFDTNGALKAQQSQLNSNVVNLADYIGKTQTAADKNKALALAAKEAAAAEKLKAELQKEALGLTDQFASNQDKLAARLERLNLLQKETNLSQETYAAAVRQANLEFSDLGELESARSDILTSLKTKQDEYNESVAKATRLHELGEITGEQYAATVANAFKELNKKTEETQKALIDTDQFAIQAARNIQSSFADFLFDPFDKGLKGMLGSLATTLQRMAAEILANAALKGALQYLSSLGGSQQGSGGGIAGTIAGLAGTVLSGLGGGAAADGARVKAGQPFLVGERGPELFIPNTQGVIEPNTGAMGGETTVNVTVNGIRDEGGLRQTANQIAYQAGNSVQRARARNG